MSDTDNQFSPPPLPPEVQMFIQSVFTAIQAVSKGFIDGTSIEYDPMGNPVLDQNGNPKIITMTVANANLANKLAFQREGLNNPSVDDFYNLIISKISNNQSQPPNDEIQAWLYENVITKNAQQDSEITQLKSSNQQLISIMTNSNFTNIINQLSDDIESIKNTINQSSSAQYESIIFDLTNQLNEEKETRAIMDNQHLNRIKSIENQIGVITNTQDNTSPINEESLNNAIQKIRSINLKNFFK